MKSELFGSFLLEPSHPIGAKTGYKFIARDVDPLSSGFGELSLDLLHNQYKRLDE